jgi:eukaryotic-like serine/threonine-protein kinase
VATFGRFQITGELGRGGMGAVFRAYDPDMAREVALKVLRADPSLSPAEVEELRSRFDREAKAAGGLSHPAIVAHFERGEIAGHRFIVMELVEGRSLLALMTDGARPEGAAALALLGQVAAALDYAHARGVIHRDVKPANILLQADGSAKIADFGIAKCAASAARPTASSVIIGSPHYMAPEQIEAHAVDGRTDQWSLAVTAYELLTGAKPFHSESVVSLFQSILSAAPPDPSQYNPRIPKAAQAVFGRALSKAPDGRFESCAAFVEALSAAITAGDPASNSTRSTTRRVVVRIKPQWIGAAVAFIVAFGALLSLAAANLDTISAAAGLRGAVAVAGPSQAPRAGEIRKNRRAALEYTWIAPGAFTMGCSEGDTDCQQDEAAHLVTLSKGFWLGRTEVTAGAYKRFCHATGAALPPPPGFNPEWADESAPIANVSWHQAAQFCRWAAGRLPTEAEWEFAVRAKSTGARYDDLEKVAWTRATSGLRSHPAALLQPNRYGLFDMLGNVWEWTGDRYQADYFAHSPATDPGGPDAGDFRVLRGGSWLRDTTEARASERYPAPPGDPDQAVGFRCAADEMP